MKDSQRKAWWRMARRRAGGGVRGRAQKQLCLVFPNGWGGRREGAGRKTSSKRRNVRHQVRPGHRAAEPVHVTLRSGFRPLRSAFVFPTLRGAIRDLNQRWKERFRVVHFSVQSDHLHLLVEAVDRRALLGGVRGLSVSVARRVNRLVFRRGGCLRIAGMAVRCPRREPSVTRSSTCWGTSGSTNHREAKRWTHSLRLPIFRGLQRLQGSPSRSELRRIAGRDVARGSPVLEPRTWLLRAGWRRHGLISIREAPRRH
jgi:REP element-mobilizing transposase RayT